MPMWFMNSPLVAGGGIVIMAAVYLASVGVGEQYECGHPGPTSCTQLTNFPEEVLEQRDGEYIGKFTQRDTTDAVNTLKRSTLREWMPEEFTTYEACSTADTGGVFQHNNKGQKYIDFDTVSQAANSAFTGMDANGLCAVLGCGHKECLARRYICQANSDNDWIPSIDGDNRPLTPQVWCTAAMPASTMGNVTFVSVFMLFFLGLLMCLGGCMAGKNLPKMRCHGTSPTAAWGQMDTVVPGK